MGSVYLFALVVGLGTLLVQIILGGKGDAAHGGGDTHVGPSGDADHEAELEGEAGAHHGAGKDLKHAHADADGSLIALFLSTRFWIFALLAFGMSGSMIHFLELAGFIATLVIAIGAGFASGLFATLVFRAVKRASVSTSAHADEAIGQIGRVLVACRQGRPGKVRIELRGHSVDMLATTDDVELARGEMVLVEDVKGETAHVSRSPRLLCD